MEAPVPVPVNVITGALGVGKTSVIAKLLAAKPVHEYWVVILNEFTDAGLDAIALASAARGPYDVRVIPGGCLCCTGELDFRRQLRQLMQERRPHRILIEPSGIGHPGAVIEELRGQERAGALRLASTIGLVDPQRLDFLARVDDSTERAQLESSDVLILTKADIATPADRERFIHCAENMFPAKRWLGTGIETLLSGEALDPPRQPYTFELPSQPYFHRHQHREISKVGREVRLGSYEVGASVHTLLGRQACGWTIAREAVFNRVRLHEALQSGANGLRVSVERLKAVLRTGVEHWTLFNVSEAGVTAEPCGWRQDSRIEVQLRPGESMQWEQWDELFAAMVVR